VYLKFDRIFLPDLREVLLPNRITICLNMGGDAGQLSPLETRAVPQFDLMSGTRD
jgi:hypothetical protein